MRKRVFSLICFLILVSICLIGCGEKQVSYVDTGMEQIQNLDYDGALGSFDQAENAGESERLILRGRGIAYLAKADYSASIDCFTQALEASSGIPENMDYDINYYLATAYYKSGQVDQAIQVYNAILALRPKEESAYYLRGCAFLAKNDSKSALEDFEQAIALDEKDYEQIIRIYQVLSQNGYAAAGQEILTRIVDERTDIDDYDRGRLCYCTGDYPQAKEALEKANMTPSAGTALYLGKTYEAMGDYNYAIDTYRTYLDTDSEQPVLYNQMGLCQMKMEKYDDALASFQNAMNMEGTEIMQTLKFNEIVAYEHIGDFQTAATLMNAYLKTYPDDAQAAREYEFLKTR